MYIDMIYTSLIVSDQWLKLWKKGNQFDLNIIQIRLFTSVTSLDLQPSQLSASQSRYLISYILFCWEL